MAQTQNPSDTASLNASDVLQGGEVNARSPRGTVLSNGRMTSVVMSTGASRLTFDGMAINRWRREHAHTGGSYRLYLRDIDSGELWNPSSVRGEQDLLTLDPGRTVVESRHQDVRTVVETFVAVDADLEVRRLTIHNEGGTTRRIDVTSYLEIALAPHAADLGHPAFSKLFVQTRYEPESNTIRAWRRLRSPEDRQAVMMHTAQGSGDPVGFETSRSDFVGRGKSLDSPAAMARDVRLGQTVGSVLDPVASLRRQIDLYPGQEATVTFFTGAARSEADLDTMSLRLADFSFEDEMTAASARDVELLLLNKISGHQARYFRRLATALFVDEPHLRAPADLVARLDAPISRLDELGIDQAVPLVVARIAGEEDLPIERTLLKAHRYWRQLGLSVNLFLFNDMSETEAAERLQASIEKSANAYDAPLHVRGGVYSDYADDMDPADQVLLQSHAAILIRERFPDLDATPADQRKAREAAPLGADDAAKGANSRRPEMKFYNGYGGFSNDGTEYVIDVAYDREEGHRLPPQPWTNVIANPTLGFIVSETGAGFTWAHNSRENRLTPWSNDPVSDPPGERYLVRDDDAGTYWNLMPGEAAAPTDYLVRHGFGYTVFESMFDGLRQQVTQFVHRTDAVKISLVDIANESGRARRLTLVGAHHLVLGADEQLSSRLVSSSVDTRSDAVVAHNSSNGEFRSRRVFSTIYGAGEDVRHRVVSGGLGLAGIASDIDSDEDGNGEHIVHQRTFVLEPGERASVAVLLGEAESDKAVRQLLSTVKEADAWKTALEEVKSFWRDLLGGVRISTPRPEIDFMVNGWLPYQNLVCRLWGRSAFYQSGGAFGFRDQLQDAAAMIYLDPDITRRQIIVHAEQQFPEGDVMHWWHPPSGKGIRTRFSDDLLWLPFVTTHYLETTGDRSVLDETTSYIQARPLAEGEDEIFVYPERLDTVATVYEHCCLAIDRSLTRGVHGLPLMGTGDWNDGMNRVGREGKGESVWLGFFLAYIIDRMIPVCQERGDMARVEAYRNYREHLQRQLNDTGWDGEWYRRAYYDSGAPLGSRESDEGKIDALAQAWAVISGVAPPERATSALDAMEAELVDEATGIIRLLKPAFDKTPNDPGYIKGYLPGVRENGGQYTHAALWAVKALAEAGRHDRAARLLAMLSPISHSRTVEAADRYRVEPYVVAADVYGEPPHVGRGGWTWYTGSAGWMYRVAIESILGFRVVDGSWIELSPAIPDDWPAFSISYRLPGENTVYEIEAGNGDLTHGVEVDDEPLEMTSSVIRIPISHDGKVHRVRISLA